VTKRPKAANRQPGAGPNAAPTPPTGKPGTGRILRIVTGQNHGFIKDAHGRELFFHRSDFGDDAAFYRLVEGEEVAFELIEDRVSGPRAIRVRKNASTKP
jgi:cold shock CspA family protein